MPYITAYIDRIQTMLHMASDDTKEKVRENSHGPVLSLNPSLDFMQQDNKII